MQKKFFTTREIILIGIFTAFTAVMAQISIPLSFSPVPITLQVFAVCLSAAVLGSRCGAVSQLVYILLGVVGVPVFSRLGSGLGVIIGPKGGYIVSFPIVALVTGLIIERSRHASFWRILAAMSAGLVLCYAVGAAWLGAALELTLTKALVLGVGWYLPLDAVKIVLAAMISFKVRESLLKTGYLRVEG